MASRISIDAPKPMAVIFLDIEGILVHSSDQKIQEAAHQIIEKWGTPPHKYSIDLKRAITHCFSQPAVDNLMELIEKTSKIAKVGIVIASSWREELAVDVLVNEIFVDTPFAHLIIDKIPDSHSVHLLGKFDGKISPNKKLPSDIASEKYGFSLSDDDRSKEIDFWLRENKERFQINRFVIINNYNPEIVDRYPNHGAQVHPKRLFSKSDTDEAYHILLRNIPSLYTSHSEEPEEKMPTERASCCVIS